jgi:hypothetical protein
VFLQNISDCLGGDLVGDNGVDVFGGLDSIGSFASGDLLEDGVCSSGREFGRPTKVGGLSIGKKVLEYSGDSGLANTSLRGNIASGVAMGSKRKDIFLVSRRNGAHIKSGVS